MKRIKPRHPRSYYHQDFVLLAKTCSIMLSLYVAGVIFYFLPLIFP